jgi:protein SCO1
VKYIILVLVLSTIFSSCNTPEPRIKVMGDMIIARTSLSGKEIFDTVSSHIPAFAFTSQYGTVVDTGTVANQVYVVDFFFTHCPSICPKMAAQMRRIYDKYGATGQVKILSHSIDPVRDSVPVLVGYAGKLHVVGSNWLFLTGNKDSIYAIADKYLAFAKEDKDAPGGFVHDGNFILMDKQRRVRGYYDGTKDDKVDQLLLDIETLLHEK